MYIVKDFCADYWLNNVIVDCGSVEIVNDNDIDQYSSLDTPEDETQTGTNYTSENNLTIKNNKFEISYKINENIDCCSKYITIEKLNNNHNYLNKPIYNEPEIKSKSDRKDRQFDRGNIKREKPRILFGGKIHREQHKLDRIYIEKKSNQHISIHKCSLSNHNERKMQTMSKTSSIHDIESRKGKVLLDSFSKPLIC